MQNLIILRVVAFVQDNRFHLLCLETDIAVVGDSLHEAKQKISDALIAYFKSFSDDEIINGNYLRKAPMRYRFLFTISKYVYNIMQIFKNLSSFTVNYDKNSEHLSFA